MGIAIVEQGASVITNASGIAVTDQGVSAIADPSTPDLLFWNEFQDFVPSRPVEHLGESDLTFEGRLPEPGLQIYEDGGELGCGGKVWIAGELLSKYLLDKGLYHKKKVVEIGSGTGLVGLTLGLSEKRDEDMEVWITDIEYEKQICRFFFPFS